MCQVRLQFHMGEPSCFPADSTQQVWFTHIFVIFTAQPHSTCFVFWHSHRKVACYSLSSRVVLSVKVQDKSFHTWTCSPKFPKHTARWWVFLGPEYDQTHLRFTHRQKVLEPLVQPSSRSAHNTAGVVDGARFPSIQPSLTQIRLSAGTQLGASGTQCSLYIIQNFFNLSILKWNPC